MSEMNQAQREPTATEKAVIADLKTSAQRLALQIEDINKFGGDARCVREALVRLDEALMWAVKGVMTP